MSVTAHEQDLGVVLYMVPDHESKKVVIVGDHLIEKTPEECLKEFVRDLGSVGVVGYSSVRHEITRSKPVDPKAAELWVAAAIDYPAMVDVLTATELKPDPVGVEVWRALQESV